MKAATYVISGIVLVAVLGTTAWWWRVASSPPQAPRASATQPMPVVQPPEPAASVAAEPVIAHPIGAVAGSAPATAPQDIGSMLTRLFGREQVLALFQVDDFPRRVVATVDNLGRSHATARLWPVNPARGRFLVAAQGGATAINADNGLRYTPHVLLLEGVDLRQLAAVYVRLYPQFQQAYEELGYPKGYFNDRLVEVIDLLLATPEPTAPVRVRRPTSNSPVEPERPWVLYEFDDPALQSLAAGQRILLRMGPVNERRIKSRLRDLRRLVATDSTAR